MASHTTELQQLYIAYFNRPADAAGLGYFEDLLTAGKLTLTEISRLFASSAEYIDTFAGLDTEQIVSKIYVNLFGRTPDTAGQAYWAALIKQGTLDLSEAVTSIAAGSLGSDRAIYDGKVAAAVSGAAADAANAEASVKIIAAVAANESLRNAQVDKAAADLKAASGLETDIQAAAAQAVILVSAVRDAQVASLAASEAGKNAVIIAAAFAGAASKTDYTTDDFLAVEVTATAAAQQADAVAVTSVYSSALAHGIAASDAWSAGAAATKGNLATSEALASANSYATARVAVAAAAVELNLATVALARAQQAVDFAATYQKATLASSTSTDDAAGAKAYNDATTALATANAALAAAKQHVAEAAALPTEAPPAYHQLTSSIDFLTGGVGVDIFQGMSSSEASVFNDYDTLDGGAGNDILNLASTHGAVIPATATIRNIETINVLAAGNVSVDLSGSVAGVTTLNIRGNGHVDVVLGRNDVTLIDASGSQGSLAVATVATASAAATVKGGAGNNVLTANHVEGVLQGGGSADTLIARADRVTLTGGGGADKFDVGQLRSSIDAHATITDLGVGDSIVLANSANSFAAAKLQVSTVATLSAYADAAIASSANGGLVWFQFAGNTYLVQNGTSAGASFNPSQDYIVKLTGIVDLSGASFDSASHSLSYGI